jgi:type IV secretory pathway TrbD component
MSEPREITNDTVFVSAIEPVLWSGCDYRLFWCLAGTCLLAAAFIFGIWTSSTGDPARPFLERILFGLLSLAWKEACIAVAFFAGHEGLRAMAKYDPLLVPVYLRHVQWPGWIPATGKVLARRRYNKLFSVESRKQG